MKYEFESIFLILSKWSNYQLITKIKEFEKVINFGFW